MLYLKSIEDKFDILPLRLKIEIFLFPLVLLFVTSYFLYEKEIINKPVVFSNIDVKKIKMKDSFVDILKQIESYSSSNNLILESIKRSETSIELEVFSTFEKLKEFLVFIEGFNNFSKIEYMQLSKDRLSIEISFKKFYQKKPYKIITQKKESPIIKDLKIKAIIDNEVLIENRWLKADDKYAGFRIVSIMPKSIVVKKDEKKIQIKLYDDGKF